MTTISYAQNYEDIMLLRALHDVERGFYIDVGAQDPIHFSVTKAFYQRGWHGINIEPVAHWHQKLVEDRPHDINLELAVSDKPGRLHLYEVADTGLSTTHAGYASRHAESGFRIHESDVECQTLDDICARYAVTEIHFLKIDCEGDEAPVLRGISLDFVRPWIIVVESTEPLLQKPTFADWEPLLTQRRYAFVYGDGLNRFYVAEERAHLQHAFANPPNIFDDFERASEAAARKHIETLESRLSIATDAQRLAQAEVNNLALTAELRLRSAEVVARAEEIGRLHREVVARDEEIGRLHREIAMRDGELGQAASALEAYQASMSWRITAPVRALGRFARASYRIGRRFVGRVARPLIRRAGPLLGPTSRWSAQSGAMAGDSSHGDAAATPPQGKVAPPLTRSATRTLEILNQARVRVRSSTNRRRSRKG